ncbi:hypothetical protein HMPREF9442_02687 [Paraprevotella xylaniphila YIT 11841]|uniref:Uncharacterized protein n=1 Tax=Paraprevotella xylaniphila YIT 11841 TaxID=762982 RepID=F3QWV6_9BACT|nr:hypothetical protein HMPREF9442_02687 [Paraprevotella xylaniphila YIT 11841]
MRHNCSVFSLNKKNASINGCVLFYDVSFFEGFPFITYLPAPS